MLLTQLFIGLWKRSVTYFQHYQSKPPFNSEKKRHELRLKLNEISGVNLPRDAIYRRPSIKMALFTRGERLDQWINIFEWMIQEIQNNGD